MKLSDGANRLNHVLEKIMPVFPILGVVLGSLQPNVFIQLKPLVLWLFGVMTFSGALNLKVKEFGKAVSSPLPFILFLLVSNIVMPLTALAFSKLIFGNDIDTISGFVLLYSSPTAVVSFIWASILGGNLTLTLAIILINTVLSPFVIPGTLKLLLGKSVSIDTTGMFLTLVFMIVIPTVAGASINELSKGKIPSLIGPFLSPLSKILVVFIIAINSAAVANQIHFNNPHLWMILAICICLSSFGFISGKLAGIAGKLNKENQISLFTATGLRNTSAAMTLGIEFFPLPTVLPPVLGIMVQQTIAAFMGRFLAKKTN